MGGTAPMAKENGKRTKNNTLQLFSASVALLNPAVTGRGSVMDAKWWGCCFISDMLCKFCNQEEGF